MMRRLNIGERVAVVSPASIIEPGLVEGAVATLRALGYEPVVMPHALGSHGSYSGTEAERLADMTAALEDESIRAIVCSRGGYGAVHLLEGLDAAVARNPKWLVGFSDISALHALWHRHGLPSLHASMCRQLAAGTDTPATRRLVAMLGGERPALSWTNDTEASNRPGGATGMLTGGNLAVIEGLAGTPYYPVKPGDIMFIEDVAEPIYKVERILYRMRLAGLLDKLGALVVGRFTDYKPNRNHATMESMIARMVEPYGYPVAYGAPIGHIGGANMPVLHGAEATVTVTADGCVLQ